MDIKDIIEEHDFSNTYKTTTVNFTNTPTRAKIEEVLVEAGETLPLASTVLFCVVDKRDKFFHVRYFKDQDVYAYEKLSVAS